MYIVDWVLKELSMRPKYCVFILLPRPTYDLEFVCIEWNGSLCAMKHKSTHSFWADLLTIIALLSSKYMMVENRKSKISLAIDPPET